MLKSIAKWLCPSSAKIATAAADRIQVGYNGVAVDKRETIARYATVANEIGEYGKTLSQMFTDGRIDDAERAKIAAALEGLIDKAKEIVFA